MTEVAVNGYLGSTHHAGEYAEETPKPKCHRGRAVYFRGLDGGVGRGISSSLSGGRDYGGTAVFFG